MTHKLIYLDQGRRLVLEIFDDTDSYEIDRVVRSIHRWHQNVLGEDMHRVRSSPEFDKWCWERSEKGETVREIARQVNRVIADSLREFNRRESGFTAVVNHIRGEVSWDQGMVVAKTGIEMGEAAKEAARLLSLARPRLTPAELEDEITTAIERIRSGEPEPFKDLLPIDPGTIKRAIARHRKRYNC